MICYICRNDVVLPVEMICFPCFSVNQIHCNSFVRICLKCAIDYLQLNRGSFERDFTRKCLTCQETVYLSMLRFSNTIKFDFQMIRDATGEIYCPFCESFTGSGMDLFHHLKECPEYMHECECKKILPHRYMLRMHQFSCPNYKHCLICDEFVNIRDYSHHQLNQHNCIPCAHCKEYLPFEELFEHEYYCLDRKVECFYCKTYVANRHLKTHFAQHELELVENIQCSKEKLSKLFDDLVAIQNFRKNILEINLLH